MLISYQTEEFVKMKFYLYAPLKQSKRKEDIKIKDQAKQILRNKCR